MSEQDIILLVCCIYHIFSTPQNKDIVRTKKPQQHREALTLTMALSQFVAMRQGKTRHPAFFGVCSKRGQVYLRFQPCLKR